MESKFKPGDRVKPNLDGDIDWSREEAKPHQEYEIASVHQLSSGLIYYQLVDVYSSYPEPMLVKA